MQVANQLCRLENVTKFNQVYIVRREFAYSFVIAKFN